MSTKEAIGAIIMLIGMIGGFESARMGFTLLTIYFLVLIISSTILLVSSEK